MNKNMKYRCGLYGGSFNPPHLGHVRCLIWASAQCETLIVVISSGRHRDELDVRVRYRWIYQLTEHLTNVKLFILTDEAASKEEYTREYWQRDAAKIKRFAGRAIDAVYCGSDYDGNSFWGECYPGAELNILPRNGMSSTALRRDIQKHWDWLPNVVKPYFVKKVLLVGGESTGKSTLTVNLANYYNTNYLEEAGRDISERSGTDLLMLPDDFTDILITHKARELEAVKHSSRVLFEDTDCLTTLFYIGFLEGWDKEKNAALARAIAQLNSYGLILFLEPDVEFVQAGGRSEVMASDRERYSRRIREIYRDHGFTLEPVGGDYIQRFTRAVELVDRLLSSGSRTDIGEENDGRF